MALVLPHAYCDAAQLELQSLLVVGSAERRRVALLSQMVQATQGIDSRAKRQLNQARVSALAAGLLQKVRLGAYLLGVGEAGLLT